MKSNHIQEPISHRGDQHDASLAPLRVKVPSMYMLQCFWVTGAGSCCVSVHPAMKFARAWDLIIVCGMYVLGMGRWGRKDTPIMKLYPML
jgi:hypothetical protein